MIKNLFLFVFSIVLSGVTFANESSVYNFSWLDKDKEIYVLQNRKFRKDKQAYVGALGVKTLSGAFIDSYGGSVRAGYFISEDWGLEFVHGVGSGKENTTAKNVQAQSSVAFYRKIESYTGAMMMWSPFYSKINTFNKVFYFDWMFGLGLASIKTEDNRNRFVNQNDKSMTSDSSTGLMWNSGLRFYLNEHWSLRLDFTALHYKPKKADTGSNKDVKTTTMLNHYDLGVGLNYGF